ncbi:MAG: hypothetical protein EPN25_07640 [Nitrospirae bacterium]|nr:MAG: hypothetical protein EPN25_07640 [Nitrospirota bacterium]
MKVLHDIPRYCSVVILLVSLLSPPCQAAGKEGFAFNKQAELQQIKPKKPVKIKLKRTAKDEYSWELAGDDVDDIIQADRRLRKMLSAK